MIKLSPSYDSAIAVFEDGLSIRFAGIPELAVVNDLYSLIDHHRGITMPNDAQNPEVLYEAEVRPERQRLYYWLNVSLVFEIEKVANSIAACLNKHHCLSVRLIFTSVTNEPDRILVLKPVKEES